MRYAVVFVLVLVLGCSRGFAQEVADTLKNSIGIKLKFLPAGRFTMGQADGETDETPHAVTLSKPYYLGVTEVTNGQWKRVMGSVPSHWKYSELPVESITWEDAREFCQKLSALPQERQAGRVYRLPTEAEWEYACRARSATQYSFGDDEAFLVDHAWYFHQGGEAHPVGQKTPNAWGLFDMHGNVSEWCSDWYGDYGRGAATDPLGPMNASTRVLRGGNWRCAAVACRSASRAQLDPSGRSSYLGFRLALDLPGGRQTEPGKQ